MKQEVTESHNEVHESVAEEKVAKRRTNSKSTMLSVKILKLVDWTQTVSIQKSESLPDSVVWNIDCEKASVLKDFWTGRVEEVPVCGSRSCKRTVVMSCETLPETVSGITVYRQCGSSQQGRGPLRARTQDVVTAASVQSMSQVLIRANAVDGFKAGRLV